MRRSGAARVLLSAAVAAGLLCAPLAAARAGSGSKSIARRFARAAKKAGVKRIAVLPFRPLDGSSPAQGRYLAEELTTFLAGREGIEVVERSMMGAVMSEHRLGRSGVLEPAGLMEIGGMLQAQGVVVGTFVTEGKNVELQARLIRLNTGVVLSAMSRRMKSKRRFADDWPPSSSPALPPPEAHEGFATDSRPLIERLIAEAETDIETELPSPDIDLSCDAAGPRINKLIGGIVDLKARFWAYQVRTSDVPGEFVFKFGEIIPDSSLRAKFHRLVEDAVRRKAPPLDAEEMGRFIASDSEAFLLHMQCLPVLGFPAGRRVLYQTFTRS